MQGIVKLTWIASGALLLAVSAIWHAGSVLVAPVPAAISDAALALDHESVSILSKSGSLVRGWYVPASQPVGAAILMHGVRANRLSMIGRAKLMHDAGYSVLLFDFQAHGESPGENLTFGYLEALDAEAAVTYLKQRTGSDFVAVIGVSLGGAAAVLGKQPLDVQALVLEAT